MPLPFTPEPIDVLRLRYPAAIAEVVEWDEQARIVAGDAFRTGQKHAHVFDCEDGLRLIISRDRRGDGRVAVHVSASVEQGTPLYEQLAGEMTIPKFFSVVGERMFALSGQAGILEFLCWSQGWVPHFVLYDADQPTLAPAPTAVM